MVTLPAYGTAKAVWHCVKKLLLAAKKTPQTRVKEKIPEQWKIPLISWLPNQKTPVKCEKLFYSQGKYMEQEFPL